MTNNRQRAKQRGKQQLVRSKASVATLSAPIASAKESEGRSFEDRLLSQAPGSSAFVSVPDWVALRESGIRPRAVSPLGGSEESREEFLRGMTLLRRHGDRALRGSALQPQMLLLSDMLDAGHPVNAVLLPRRSAKSTSVIAVGLGRCAVREDYRVGILTLTSGKAGRSRFLKDVAPAIERVAGDAVKIVRSAGQERVEFTQTDSFMQWLSSPDDLRGEAFDLVLLDEGGEPDIEKADDVVAAALPTTDTRPGAQLVVLGTGPRFRSRNLLHEWLERGRSGVGGILDYSAPASTTVEDIETWEMAEPLVIESHPGLDGLTTLDSIKGNFEALPREAFLREYLGIPPTLGTAAFINLAEWEKGGVDASELELPERFMVGLSVSPNNSAASLVAAWRDEDRVAHVGMLWHGPVRGVYAQVLKVARKHGVTTVYDSISSAADSEAARLARARPKPRLIKANWAAVSNAASRLVAEIDAGNLRHGRSEELDDAARMVTRRGAKDQRRWSFGRPNAEAVITPMEAAANALYWFDEKPPRESFVGVMGD